MLALTLGATLALAGAVPGKADPERHAHHAVPTSEPDAGAALIGTPAPPLSFDRWVGSRRPPDLRGKVVLVRWWTDGCPYCAATLPALEALRARHGDDLVVLGVYHPKPPRAVSDRHVLAAAARLGFRGPLAVDAKWSALRRWWPDGDWTSVSFLVDRAGTVRWVHGGGEYHPSGDPAHARCAADHAALERAIGAALVVRPS